MARLLSVAGHMFQTDISFNTMLQAQQLIHSFYATGQPVSEGARVVVIAPYRTGFRSTGKVATGKAGWLAAELLSTTGIEAAIYNIAGVVFGDQERVPGDMIVALAASSIEALWLFRVWFQHGTEPPEGASSASSGTDSASSGTESASSGTVASKRGRSRDVEEPPAAKVRRCPEAGAL